MTVVANGRLPMTGSAGSDWPRARAQPRGCARGRATQPLLRATHAPGARVHARRILKLNFLSSSAWFGFGVNSTYFWSP
jgi:hypothetical protein